MQSDIIGEVQYDGRYAVDSAAGDHTAADKHITEPFLLGFSCVRHVFISLHCLQYLLFCLPPAQSCGFRGSVSGMCHFVCQTEMK